jgi:hypothetical protein
VDNIIPNFNPNLVVLRVCELRHAGGGEDIAEFPIVAWRIVEDDLPVPISTNGEMDEPNGGEAAMVFDRATNTGTFDGFCFPTRTDCIEDLRNTIACIYRVKQGAQS